MGATLFPNVNARPITNPTSLKLKVNSDPANLAMVRKQVEALAASIGFAEKAVAEIGLCLNEAVANIIRHAYAGRTDRPIHLDASASPRELAIAIRDWGNGIDPSQLPQRPYNPLEPGGVGLICLQQWMDEVVYTPQPDGMLTLLKKRIPRGLR
jgi:serine/threonine-protein kinase RsbW